MTTTTRTYWAIVDRHGEEWVGWELSDEKSARENVEEMNEWVSNFAPFRLVRRTVTTVDEEVA